MKKRIIILALISIIAISYSTEILFEDNFNDNSIDFTKWTTEGVNVIEENGILKLNCAQTDYGGRVTTIPIDFSGVDTLIISRKSKVHYANSYFYGYMILNFSDEDLLPIQIYNYNLSYGGGNSQPTYGIYVSKNAASPNSQNANPDDIFFACAGIWNEWYDELIKFNPDTGEFKYYINNELLVEFFTDSIPDSEDRTLEIYYYPYGWWTGHYGYMDDFIVSGNIGINANFTANETTIPFGEQIQFTDTSLGNPTSWEWDFDNDGTIDSYEQNPLWTYDEVGTFSVSLNVSNGSTSDTEIKEDYITVNYPPIEISPESGNYVDDIWVKVNSDVDNVIIKFTTDGSEPTENHGEIYTDSLHFSPTGENQTYEIKAVALVERQQRDGSTYTVEIGRANADYLLNFSDNVIFNFVFESTEESIDITKILINLGIENNITKSISHWQTNPISPIFNNNLSVSKSMLNSIFAYSPNYDKQIYEILLYNQDEFIGHINLNYTFLDYLENKKLDAKFFIHSLADRTNYLDWEYFEEGERMVSMLIPPKNSFSEIDTSLPATLFVQGIGEKYPYWGETFIGDLDNEFNSWQLYFPYDQQIENNAILLKNAISVILDEDYALNDDRVNIVAHSMGGLVTRQYIQSINYDNDINKFLMLGTPNHGSLASYNLTENINFEVIGNEILVHQDGNSPANKQMIPGSSFLFDVNSSEPKILYSGSNNSQTYLIVAGAFNPIKNLHEEIKTPSDKNYDDMVVSIPSANLLEFDIPLVTVSKPHTALTGLDFQGVEGSALSSSFIPYFLNNDYNPEEELNSQYLMLWGMVNGYWLNTQTCRKSDDHLPENKSGILQVQFSDMLQSNTITVSEESGSLILAVNEVDEETFNNRSGRDNKGKLYKVNSGNVNKSNYFLQNTTGRNHLGNPFTSTYSSVKIKKKIRFWWDKTIKVYSSSFSFNDFVTSMVEFEISNGELAIINADNSTSNSSSRITRNRNNRTVIEEDYYVDATMDSMVFYMGGFENNPDFANHNMTLITPDEAVIDSAYANNDPNMEYSEDIENGFAFYYVVNPQQGLWKLQYNDALPDSNTVAFLDSPISIHIEIPDTNYVKNDSVFFEIPLPQPIEYTNVQITAELNFRTQNDSLVILGNIPLELSSDSLSYTGDFIAEDFGSYEISVDFNCILYSEQIERHTYNSVSVSNVSPPELVSPANGSYHQPLIVDLSWDSAKNATAYNVQVFTGSDSLAFVEAAISDTTFILNGLSNNTEYYWQVNSENENGVSSWSFVNYFSTKITSPELVFPENANDNVSSNSQLIWNFVDNAIGYQVQLAFDELFDEPIINDSTIVDSFYVLNSLINGYSYFWRVRGRSDFGESDWSEIRSFTVREFDIDFPEIIEFPEDSISVIYLPDYISDFDLGRTTVEVSGNIDIQASQDNYIITLSADENWNGQESLILTVFDGINSPRATISDTIFTSINPVNDPPSIDLPDSIDLFYGESIEIDFSQFISDVDNELNELSLSVEENSNIDIQITNHLVTISGINNWVGEDLVVFFVDDSVNPVREIRKNLKRKSTNTSSKDSKRNNQTNSTRISNNTRSLTSDQVLVILKLMIPDNLFVEYNENECIITWDSVPAANGYNVYSSLESNSPFNEWVLETATPISDTYWIDTENVDKKFFRIVAVNGQVSVRSFRKNILRSTKMVNRKISNSNQNQKTSKEEIHKTKSSSKIQE